MIKNIFVTFMTFVFVTSTSFAQVPEFKLKASLELPKRSELVTKPKTVEETLKKHFREDSFVLKGEVARHQGYILTIQDRKAIKSIFRLVESSCGTLVEATGESCKEELDKCQEDCDDRVKKIENKNEKLTKDNDKLIKKLESEEKKKYIFLSIATVSGFVLGSLFMVLSKK